MEGEVEGLGDVGLSARIALDDPHRASVKVNALALLSLPTGKVETDFLDQNIVLGAGSISAGTGLELIRDSPTGSSAFLRAAGSKPTGPSGQGIRFGGSLSASAGYGRPFAAAGRTRWAISGAVSWNEADRDGDNPLPNRGGRLVTVTGGLTFPAGGGSEASIGIQRLVSADLRGDQLAARWSGFLGFRWTRAVRH